MIPDLKINKMQLQKAVDKGIINQEQLVMLWQFWQKENKDIPQFRAGHMLYYFGGLLSIVAVTLLIGLVWEKFKGTPLLLFSTFLFLVGLMSTNIFNNKKLIIPAGIMAAFSLVLVPLIVYNIQFIMHLTPDQFANYENFNYLIRVCWLPMEIITLIAGGTLFYFYRFNFILLPVSIILWHMSMDLYQVVFKFKLFELVNASWFSLMFGLIGLFVLICWDYVIELKNSDRLFWLYLAATLIFWSSLSVINANYHYFGNFVYLLINLLMLVISVILQRKIFAICATMGIFWYLSDLAVNSIILPFILIFAGFLIIYLATKWAKVETSFMSRYNKYLPKRYRTYLTK